jgi:hypothetical protein
MCKAASTTHHDELKNAAWIVNKCPGDLGSRRAIARDDPSIAADWHTRAHRSLSTIDGAMQDRLSELGAHRGAPRSRARCASRCSERDPWARSPSTTVGSTPSALGSSPTSRRSRSRRAATAPPGRSRSAPPSLAAPTAACRTPRPCWATCRGDRRPPRAATCSSSAPASTTPMLVPSDALVAAAVQIEWLWYTTPFKKFYRDHLAHVMKVATIALALCDADRAVRCTADRAHRARPGGPQPRQRRPCARPRAGSASRSPRWRPRPSGAPRCSRRCVWPASSTIWRIRRSWPGATSVPTPR